MAWTARFEPPDLDPEYLSILLDGLLRIDVAYLRRNPRTPHPYEAGVVYQREPPHQEKWASVPRILERGYGDCEDLACWLVAHHIVHGTDPLARVTFTHRDKPDGVLYHILCRRGSGVIEDPSKRLGMGNDRVDRRGTAPRPSRVECARLAGEVLGLPRRKFRKHT